MFTSIRSYVCSSTVSFLYTTWQQPSQCALPLSFCKDKLSSFPRVSGSRTMAPGLKKSQGMTTSDQFSSIADCLEFMGSQAGEGGSSLEPQPLSDDDGETDTSTRWTHQ
eukprot:4474639-Amphidinium_carterae.1